VGLQSLDLSRCFEFDYKNVEKLSVLVNLTDLNLYGCFINLLIAQSIYSLTNLNTLDISGIRDCDEEEEYDPHNKVLIGISQLQGLNELYLSNQNMVTVEVMAEIAKLSQLKVLDISSCGIAISNTVVRKYISQMFSLTNLNLNWCSDIDILGIKYLSQLHQLKRLSVNGIYIFGNKCLEEISNMKELTSLSLSRSKIMDSGTKCLTRLVNLIYLDISYTFIESDTLRRISKLPKLQSLNISGCFNIKSGNLSYLGKCKSLSSLYLNECKVEDSDIEDISQIANLSILTIKSCPLLTLKAIRELVNSKKVEHIIQNKFVEESTSEEEDY
jgi:Leucine-rich repeat (LRR) protein